MDVVDIAKSDSSIVTLIVTSMASLRTHPKSRFYIACFTDHTGKQRQKSTKQTDRVKALKIAQALEDSYRRKMSELQLRSAFSQISQEIHGDGTFFESISGFLLVWLENKKVELAHPTFLRYKSVVGRFLKFLGEKKEEDLLSLTASDVTRYRNAVAAELKSGTTNLHLKVLRTAFDEACRANKISINPAKQVRRVQSNSESARRPFTIDEIKTILSAAEGEMRGIVLMGLCTGQRLGDISCLKWGNVDLGNRSIRLTTQKTKRGATIWIVGILFDYLCSLDRPNDPAAPVFPEAHDAFIRAKKVHPISKQFHTLLVNVGLAKPWEDKRSGAGRSVARNNTGLNFHMLRHTTTSFLKRSGVPEAIVMAIIGHTSRAVSENYTHMDYETITHWMQKTEHSCFADLDIPRLPN